MTPTDWSLSRRQLLSGLALGTVALPVPGQVPAITSEAIVEASHYGVVGDGSTLNDAALTAALGAMTTRRGGVLHLGVGTFLFSKPIAMPPGTVIEGAGIGVTLLRCISEVTGVTFTSTGSRCGLRSLSLEGTGKKGTGLQIGERDFTGNHHVRDVLIRGWAAGCRLAGALWTTFDSTIFTENSRGLDFNAGWSSGYSTTVAFRQCIFSANDYGGVTATNTPIMSSNISWLGCTIERNCKADPGRYPQMAFASGDYGISGVIIDGCYFEAGGKPPPDAIHANGLNCGRISNCTFNDSAYAIRDTSGGNGAGRIAIFGNRFTGSIVQNLHFERDTEILAYCNAYGSTGNTISGPGSGSISATMLQSQTSSEGEWIPALAGSARGGSHRYDKQQGRYRRSGNQVSVCAHVTLQRLDPLMSGRLIIAGLPLPACGSGLSAVAQVSAGGLVHAPGYTSFQGLIAPAGTSIEIVESGSGLPRAAVPAHSAGEGAEIIVSAIYTT